MTYNCVNGYIINGESTRVCQASSTWSGSAPTCERTFPTYRVSHYMNTRYLLQLIKFGKINSLSYLVSYSLVCRRNPFMDTTAVLYMLNLMLSFGLILTIDFQAYNNFFCCCCFSVQTVFVEGPGWPKS